MTTIVRIYDDMTVHVDGKEIRLTPIENKILRYLMQHKNQIRSRQQILRHTWSTHTNQESNVIDVHIKNLRRKLKRGKNPSVIETLWGYGYRFNDHRKNR